MEESLVDGGDGSDEQEEEPECHRLTQEEGGLPGLLSNIQWNFEEFNDGEQLSPN